MSDTHPAQHLVRLPLGVVAVALDRRWLALEARGGFEARWATAEEAVEDEILSPEGYRKVVKAQLREAYLDLEGREPGAVALNLASHQLMDDLEGWSKLNSHGRPDP